MLRQAFTLFQFASLIFVGAIFGFFYAYYCSAINGLDTMSGIAAIDAMNAINGAIRNARFFPVFFLTPLICVIAAILGWKSGFKVSAKWLFAAAIIYAVGGIALTASTSIPLNEALMAQNTNVLSETAAKEIWTTYSNDWSFWNLLRTTLSGLALVCVGLSMRASHA